MKKLLFALIAAAVLVLSCLCAAETQAPAIDSEAAQARRMFLWKYRFDDSVNQVLIVSRTRGYDAKVFLYEKQGDDNAWTLVFESAAFVGKNGMGKTSEGDSKTPSGEYEITGAFGIKDNPGTALSYTSITPSTFACDEDCEYYNKIVDTEATGHECKGEEMYLYSPEYNYGLTTSYNSENVYPLGSAIFIHCKGQKPFTGGCVALDESDMLTLLLKAEAGMKVYFDDYYSAD